MKRPYLRNLNFATISLSLLACTLPGCGTDGPTAAGSVVPGPPTAEGTEPVDYVIIAADPLSGAAARLKAYRESTGHTATVVLVGDILEASMARADAAAKIRDRVKSLYETRAPARTFYVVLLGDSTDDAIVDGTTVPADEFVDPKTKATIITDNTYADMDGDGLPDLAVGRIAVSSEAEADVVIEKTKRFEQTYEVGEWNRRLSLFASTAGFGDQIDAQIEGLVFKLVEEIPYDYDINLTYAKQSSPYVFVPERFSDKVYERLNEGSLMMTYVGHGYENGFASLDWNGKSYPILDTARLDKINITHRVPILTLIACLTGRFTSGESLSEEILKTADGPVAVYSSTEVSHPYANAVFIRELSQTLTVERAPTVGEIFTRAKRRSIENTNDPLRKDIDAGVSTFLLPKLQESLRFSHLYMYALFGDPAARVAYPRHGAKVSGAATATPGSALSVTATAEGLGGGSARVTLERRRSTTPTVAPVPPDGDPTRDDVIAANYVKANDLVVSQSVVKAEGGTFEATVNVPADLPPGDYWVKVYADDGSSDVTGSMKVTVP